MASLCVTKSNKTRKSHGDALHPQKGNISNNVQHFGIKKVAREDCEYPLSRNDRAFFFFLKIILSI